MIADICTLSLTSLTFNPENSAGINLKVSWISRSLHVFNESSNFAGRPENEVLKINLCEFEQ